MNIDNCKRLRKVLARQTPQKDIRHSGRFSIVAEAYELSFGILLLLEFYEQPAKTDARVHSPAHLHSIKLGLTSHLACFLGIEYSEAKNFAINGHVGPGGRKVDTAMAVAMLDKWICDEEPSRWDNSSIKKIEIQTPVITLTERLETEFTKCAEKCGQMITSDCQTLFDFHPEIHCIWWQQARYSWLDIKGPFWTSEFDNKNYAENKKAKMVSKEELNNSLKQLDEYRRNKNRTHETIKILEDKAKYYTENFEYFKKKKYELLRDIQPLVNSIAQIDTNQLDNLYGYRSKVVISRTGTHIAPYDRTRKK